MDQDNGIEEQPSTSKITQKAESREKVNGTEKEDGSDRHSETSGTNSRSINSKIEVAKTGPTITLGPKEVKQKLQSDDYNMEPKKKHTRSTGRVEKRTLPRRVAVRRPVKRARRDPKVEYKRKRVPSCTTVFTRLTSATSIGSCKYCGHRCCKRRYEITRRVRVHKRKRRKRQIRIIYNCVSTQTTGAELKKKWNNIQDYYRKEIQKTKSLPTGSAAKKPKTYVYSSLLYFLAPVFSSRKSEGSYPIDDAESTQPQQQLETDIEPEDINRVESPVPTLPMVSQKKKKNVPNQKLSMLQQKQKIPSAIDEDDDTKYLLSFRSYMKAMNAHQKIDFKVGMLQLVKKNTMGNEPSPSTCRYTNYYHQSDDSSGSFPMVGNNLSPSPTFIPSYQNIHVPKVSPIYLQSPSPSPPSFYPSSQQQNVPRKNTRKPIIIHSISSVRPPQSTTKQSPKQDYPVEISIPNTSVEDNEATQFLVLQSQDSQKGTMQEFLNFK